MSLLYLLLTIALIGVVAWLLENYVPMNPFFKTLIRVIAIVAVIWYVLSAFGLIGQFERIQVPRVR